MDANMKKRNELLAKTVIKGLESRNMSGYYAQDKEVALKQALELIPNGSTIAMGGFMSAHEIGLVKALQEGEYNHVHSCIRPWRLCFRLGSVPGPALMLLLYLVHNTRTYCGIPVP